MKRLPVVALFVAVCAGSVGLLGASPSPSPTDLIVKPEASVLGGAPQAGPAPRLEMNDYRPQALDPMARGAIRTRIAFPSKTLGFLWWKQQTVYVMPDNAYTRWVIASFTDRWLHRTTSFTVDPAVDRCCTRTETTDDQGNAAFQHLPPGKYVMFGAYYAQTGHSQDSFANYPGYDENGNAVQTSIPTLEFSDAIYETYVVVSPFTIAAGAPPITVDPIAVVHEVYR